MERSGQTAVDSTDRRVDEWWAVPGGRIDDLGKNPGYFPTTPEGHKFSTTGLALLAGLITIPEQRQGAITHAIHAALLQMRRSAWAPSAERADGDQNDPNAISHGTTFRFPAGVDLDLIDMDPYARMIARAGQKRRMVVRDTAGAVVLCAENPLWKGADHPYSGPAASCDVQRDALKRLTPPTARTNLGASRGTNWRRFRRLFRSDYRFR